MEIHRENLPAGTITHGTSALSDHPTPSSTGVLTLPSSALVRGPNVLAVSLHSASGEITTAFASTLEGTELPASLEDSQGLVFSEISSALDASFFVEVQNPTASPINTDGYLLEISGNTPAFIPLPVTTLNPGDFLFLDQIQLGQIPSDNDKLFLFTPGNTSVSDAKRVTNRLRGCSTAYPDLWLFPKISTPGSANVFSFEDSIVINEICYNAPSSDPSPGTPPTKEVTPVVTLDSPWRYNESGADLGSNWASTSHPVGGNWQSGPAPLAYDTGLGSPIATLLTDPSANLPRVVTYYFETDFTLTPEEATSLSGLSLTHVIDDGAIIYLNGLEIDRVNMPTGPVTASTFADAGVGDAVFVGPYSVALSPGIAVAGANRVSVEVHQSTLNSSDVAFNLAVQAEFTTDPGTPAIPALPGDEQWIEIFNRGPSTIDLTGWNFSEGIGFTFPDHTRLASGEYLVIAKDPAALAAAHPGLVPLGPYVGSLSRNGETITLRDSFNNPADRLRYFDGGRWPAQADAAGSTLELIDPDADNALPAAWSASNEVSRTSWQTYTFRATASPSTIGPDNQWRDFVLGMPEEGEVLIDDVTATDSLGASNFIPRSGPDSRAMFEVEDNRAATTGINNVRIVMDPADQAWMHTPRNVMSNGRIPCTVIDQEKRIYYDAGARIKGSQRARTQNNRVGFNLGFPKDQLFRNVHRTIAIDRSEGQILGQRELLFDLMATSSGGIPGEHNDLCYLISPNPTHTSAAILQMARFGSVFLADQFENGEDGTVYEYELIYYPTTDDAQGFKLPQPDNVLGRDLDDMGDDPENYRWTYLIKNNQEIDDYDPAMRLGKLFSESTGNFNAQVAEVLDVDQWLRALAYSCATGAGDSFYASSKHNGQFYGRPDGKILYFPHDLDFSFNATRSIFENTELNRILSASPAYRRAYLAHLYDICSSVYNQAWMSPWTSHFDEIVPGGSVFSDDLSYINTRSNDILNQVNSQAPAVTFSITTNSGNNFATNDSPVELQGNGWLDVEEIRLASSSQALPITWRSNTSWSVAIPLAAGVNPINLEAYDRLGNLLGTDSIIITQNGGKTLPDSSNLIVSELYYNEPGSGELTEYLEFMNIDPLATLELTGVTLTDGISFTFPVGTTLGPKERVVITADQVAFRQRFGAKVRIAGNYDGNPADHADLDGDGWTVLEEFLFGGSPLTNDDLNPETHFDPSTSLFAVKIKRRAGVDATLTLQQSSDLQNWITSPEAALQSSQRIPGSSPPTNLQTWLVPFSRTSLYFRFKLKNH